MIFHQLISDMLPSRKDISHTYLVDETRLVQSLLAQAELSDALSSVIAERARQLIINTTKYGLTLGIHSRIKEKADYIVKRARVGNIYVNCNMIGAVVGAQPFGGEDLSGTGPKAGGPNYLQRLVLERTVSINTSAIGEGNATLINLKD